MAPTPSIAMALATPNPSMLSAQLRDSGAFKSGLAAAGGHSETVGAAAAAAAGELLTPPNSISPNLPAHGTRATPPPMRALQEHDMDNEGAPQDETDDADPLRGTPLSKGALSGLDASAAITPAMLAKHHLPGIMLGNGPRPIRYVMGELMRLVPGFSRIPPAKARRLVVAALESRHGGGVDGNVAFCKTGWGRWDAHIKGSSTKDSAIGSFPEGHLSPPRSEHSSFAAFSANDSAVHIPRPKMASGYRDHQSGGSWTTSSHRIEEEADVDMDALENEADKMSLDGESPYDEAPGTSSSDLDDETEDEDWAAVGAEAIRKASLPAPGAPRRNYQALSIPYSSSRWPSRSWSRRPSGLSDRSHSAFGRSPNFHSTSLHMPGNSSMPAACALDPSMQTPEEKAAIAALMSLGSM